ncbi:hypothetical protein B0H11DRAFT_2208816 [Mycena galericulata]|nr:hypothetical protein B0H11DRAFT_2208816 [Mycena galericulata]
MPSSKGIPKICLLLVLATTACAQSDPATAVTLWQFGPQDRLYGGDVTLPMVPLGTASDGGATTYLYQVLIPTTLVTTDTVGGFSTEISPSTVPRTIIVSPSGWQEPGEDIACELVNPDFGQCFDTPSTVPSNSGTPVPHVVLISLSTTPTSASSASTPGSPSVSQPTASSPAVGAGDQLSAATSALPITPSISLPSTSSTNTATDAQNTQSHSRPPSLGAIVGATVGAFLALSAATVALALCLRRGRQQRRQMEDAQPQPYNASTSGTTLHELNRAEMGEIAPVLFAPSAPLVHSDKLSTVHQGRQRGAVGDARRVPSITGDQVFVLHETPPAYNVVQ